MNHVTINNLAVSKNGKVILSVDTLSITKGSRLSIRGANGSGKSTLLRVIGGLESEFDGECSINELASQCVYVHQTPFLFRGTVLTNVMYGLNGHAVPKSQRLEMAMHWLRTFGIVSLASRRVTGLSGGERRRVALARAMAVQPGLLLLDEPLADLDEAGCDATLMALQDVADDVSVVIASPTPLPMGLCEREFTLKTPTES